MVCHEATYTGQYVFNLMIKFGGIAMETWTSLIIYCLRFSEQIQITYN